MVGLDGGYVHDWADRKNNFEVIIVRSMTEDGSFRYVGFVNGLDRKAKRRLIDVLDSQGMQANQDIIILTDGSKETKKGRVQFFVAHGKPPVFFEFAKEYLDAPAQFIDGFIVDDLSFAVFPAWN